jgi:hypothetical protein
MLRKLEREAVEADLSAVEELLNGRSEADDPIGWLQFQERKETLANKLAEIGTQPALAASVALLFGGLPVLGSRGIDVEFGTKAVEQFQDVVSKRYAEQQGPLGSRAPVRLSSETGLIITDVVRGSFGFVLEEPDSNNNNFIETPLKAIVDDVLDLIYRTSAPDEEAFDAFVESVDPRVLGSIKSFFGLLYSAGATMRLVEDERDIELSRESIDLARARTDALHIEEVQKELTGNLYLLPETRRFELHTSYESIRGTVSPELMNRMLGQGTEIPPGLLGVPQSVIVNVRTVTAPNLAAKKMYRLIDMPAFTGRLHGVEAKGSTGPAA